MKKFAFLICLSILTTALTLTASAQGKQSKDELFGKIAKMSQTKKPEDLEKAYQMSKDFLAQYGSDKDEKVTKTKDFVEKYRTAMLNKKIDEGKTAEAYVLGKEILAQEPENSYITMNLAYGGYEALTKNKDKSFSADSVKYAKQTLSLLDAGKLPKNFQPFKDQAEATALMYYIIGSFMLETDAKEAAQNFYKSLQYESKIKNTSYPYYIIAFNYEKEYEKAAKDFEAKHGKKTQTDAAMKTDSANLEKIINRMLDAYARTVKIAQAENNPSTNAWKQRYAEIYKFIKPNDPGMDEYLNNIMKTPLPDPNSM
ncbi:MAG: hypothetical protein H0V31_08790 [Acidobacteria bacterium]|nr:hypothetical protein [Acidobacteriota bacterium]